MIQNQTQVDLYRKMFLSRYAEEVIQREYFDDEMKTPMHMSMGSEHIAAGLCQALGDRGRVFGTYRSHALYLARTEDTDGFFGEMYGKQIGCCKGKAGSMHLNNPKLGFMGASAIVSSIIPIAVGYAYSNLKQGIDDITAVCFGDGATNEGAFWESLNLACVKKVPILFVLEDNDLAMHTPKCERDGYNLRDAVQAFDKVFVQYHDTEVESVYELVRYCLSGMRASKRPGFAHFKYYRYLEHVGVKTDFDKGYRSEDEYKKWLERDPIMLWRKKLQEDFGFHPDHLLGIEQEVTDKVEKSLQRAKEAPFSPVQEIYDGVYYGE